MSLSLVRGCYPVDETEIQILTVHLFLLHIHTHWQVLQFTFVVFIYQNIGRKMRQKDSTNLIGSMEVDPQTETVYQDGNPDYDDQDYQQQDYQQQQYNQQNNQQQQYNQQDYQQHQYF